MASLLAVGTAFLACAGTAVAQALHLKHSHRLSSVYHRFESSSSTMVRTSSMSNLNLSGNDFHASENRNINARALSNNEMDDYTTITMTTTIIITSIIAVYATDIEGSMSREVKAELTLYPTENAVHSTVPASAHVTTTTSRTRTSIITSCPANNPNCSISSAHTGMNTTTHLYSNNTKVPPGLPGKKPDLHNQQAEDSMDYIWISHGSKDLKNSSRPMPYLKDDTAIDPTTLLSTSLITSCLSGCTIGSTSSDSIPTTYLPSKATETPLAYPDEDLELNHKQAKDLNVHTPAGPGSDGPSEQPSPMLPLKEYAGLVIITLTRIFIITNCLPEFHDCSIGSLSTEVITLTYSPGKETEAPRIDIPVGYGSNDLEKPAPLLHSLEEYADTVTVILNRAFSITRCPSGLAQCTPGSFSTESVTLAYCPGKSTEAPRIDMPINPGSNSLEEPTQSVRPVNEPAKTTLASIRTEVITTTHGPGEQAQSYKEDPSKQFAAQKDTEAYKAHPEERVYTSQAHPGKQAKFAQGYSGNQAQSLPSYNSKPASCRSKANFHNSTASNSSNVSWWLSNIERQGKAILAGATDYEVFRNVRDYGAQGDGVTDDTAAINRAISKGNRCGQSCNSSTVTPALIYFPPGTYIVSAPIVQYYYTQLIGDAIAFPTLKAAKGFVGIAIIDANPRNKGKSWFENQNNFFRQVRNFKIDMTAMPPTTGTGIHWQVAQATSLENIEFYMIVNQTDDNAQRGIFMENGSGGFMANLTFIGGRFGVWMGNQQFMTRKLTFKHCHTAIHMVWNWLWTFQDVTIENCRVGINMTNDDDNQSVGSVLLLDSKISHTGVGINTSYNTTQSGTKGTLILDNVDMSTNVTVAVQDRRANRVILEGNTKIVSWVQGREYQGTSGSPIQGARSPLQVQMPNALRDESGRVITKSKPQYTDMDVSNFISVKCYGAKGDGHSDDTVAIQRAFDNINPDQVVYFDHGIYIITDTIRISKNVRIVGEIWPMIMAGGNSTFKVRTSPTPMWKVGEKGDVGNVEIQDIMFATQGSQPGAILLELNVQGETKGSAGLFDVHFRVGGAALTELQSDNCHKDSRNTVDPKLDCFGAFMLAHVTSEASIYMENTWLWVADHELDLPGEDQIEVYNGRGILIESTKGAWLWGTASEHNVLYNYQISNAKNVFMALIQTETPYFRVSPIALKELFYNPGFFDPDFEPRCHDSGKCARAWGLRVVNSTDIFLYGGGLYSFYDEYEATCVRENNCQDNMISIENSTVHLFGVSTKASVNMVTLDGSPAALDKDNRNDFCACIAVFES